MFVFLALCSVLFILKDTVQPIPSFAEFFQNMEDAYDKKIGIVKASNSKDPQQNANDVKYIFNPYLRINESFLSDLRFPSALAAASKYYFNDFEYLVQEYYQAVPYFRDFILFKNDTAIYKHKNFYAPQTLNFTCVLDESDKTYFQLVYDIQILNDLTKNHHEPIVITYDNKRYQSSALKSLASRIRSREMNVLLSTNEGLHKMSGTRYVNTVVFTNISSSPVVVSTIVEKNMNFNLMKLLYHFFLPLMWLLILFLDRLVLRRLSFQKKMNQYRKQFLTSDQDLSHDIDESLNWFDRFIKIETINEIDTRVSHTKHKPE
ncbi:MAG: hypothetical protein ACRCS8_04745 [Brevinema sp.]